MSGFAQYLSLLPALFPIVEDRNVLSEDSDIPSSNSNSCGYALAEESLLLTNECNLTFASLPASSFNVVEEADIEAAIEFQNAITQAVWDLDGLCAAVCDNSGALHLVKSDGTILLSKQVLGGLCLKTLQFTRCDDDLQALTGVAANGTVLCMANMDVSALCEGGSTMIEALKSIKFSKWALDVDGVDKAVLLNFANDLQPTRFSVLADGSVQIFSINTSDNTSQRLGGVAEALSGHRVSDLYHWGDHCVASTEEGALLLVDVTAAAIINSLYIGHALGRITLVEPLGQQEEGEMGPRRGLLVGVQAADRSKLFSATALLDTNKRKSILIPHGFVSSAPYLPCFNETGHRHRVVSAGAAPFAVASFSHISKALGSDIFAVWEDPATLNISADNIPKQLPFGKLLGFLLACLDADVDAALIQALLRRALHQRFAPEILLCAVFLLDHCTGAPDCDIAMLAEMLQLVEGQLRASVMSENALFDSQVVVKMLKHLVHVTSLLEEGQDGASFAGAVRRLLPDQVDVTVEEMLRVERIYDATLLLEQQLWKPSTAHRSAHRSLGDWLAMLPRECQQVEAIVQLTDLLVQRASSSFGAILSIVTVLLQRGEVLAGVEGSERVAMVLVQQALRCLAPVPDDAVVADHSSSATVDLFTLRATLDRLSHHLRVHEALQEILQVYVPVEEIEQVGWQGLIFEHLSSIITQEEPQLELAQIDTLLHKLRVLTDSFSVDLDQLLSNWVREMIESTLGDVRPHDEMDEERSSAKDCAVMIDRLIMVIRNVRHPASVTPLLLKLFQLSSFSSPRCLQEGDLGTNLCALATQTLPHCHRKERDEVVEAIRLFRIRLLGYDYGVQSIELCDLTQLSTALAVIANTEREDGTCVQDAIRYAMEEDQSTLRLPYLVPCLTRSVVHFIAVTAWDDLQYDKLFNQLISKVPGQGDCLKTIVEDALATCKDEHEDSCRQLQLQIATLHPTKSAKGAAAKKANPVGPAASQQSIDELQTQCKRLVKGMIKLMEVAMDKVYSASSTGHRSAAASELSALLPSYRRLLQLHTQYDIFMTVREIQSPAICAHAVERLSEETTEKWLHALVPRSHSFLPGDPSVDLLLLEDLKLFDDSVVKMHKICRLLDSSTQLFIKLATKKMVDSGHKKLALLFSRTQLEESSIVCGSSSSTGSAPSERSGTSGADDWEAVLDTVKVISATALSPNRNTGYYSSSSTAVELDPAAVLVAHQLAQDTLRKAVSDCPAGLLNRAIDLLDIHDLVLTTYDRMEQSQSCATSSAGTAAGAASAPSSSSSSSAAPHVSLQSFINIDSVFNHDGLLLEEDVILPPLLQHCVMESKRREFTSSSKTKAVNGADIEALVKALQRNENHILALRVLYRSWTVDKTKSQLIRSSLLALTKKILTYREVDENFAIACLSSLDLDSVVKELKAAVPTSLHSDFNRLQTVASIGEEMAHLWEEDGMLFLFQGLQTNAKWWHILSSKLHIQVDLKAFSAEQSYQYAYVRSLIPEILKKTADLELACDFCRAFDIEPEIAALQYIEYMLCLPPVSPTESYWSSRVKMAALGLKENEIIRTLQRVLKKIHEVDYEKISFVCTWLLQLTPEDNEIDLDEEQEEGSGSEDLDGITASFHNLLAARAVYQRFIDLTKFLASVGLPAEVFDWVASSPTLGSKWRETYSSLHESYHRRLPFWMLTNDSWALLSVVFGSSDWAADKLLPACLLLQLSKEEFHARAAFAGYVRAGEGRGEDSGRPSVGASGALDKVGIVMKEHLLSVRSQVEVYLWVYEHEHGRERPESAMPALQTAIELLQSNAMLASLSAFSVDELKSKLLILKLERTLNKFARTLVHDKSKEITWKALDLDLKDPICATERALAVIVEHLWDLQLQDLASFGSQAVHEACRSVTVYQMALGPVGRKVKQSLVVLAPVMQELYQHCSDVGRSASAQPNTAELSDRIVASMISLFLLDSAPSGGVGQVSQASAVSLGLAEVVNPNLPTAAEYRRREDLFLGFAIFILSNLIPTEQLRLAVRQQLEQVMRGSQGFRTATRRLNARSRFRACQALLFHASAVSAECDSAELKGFHRFFFCLAELQEIRVVCSEEALAAAVGCTVLGQGQGQTAASAARSILLTWLHDESDHQAALELVRDVYVMSGLVDSALLAKIIKQLRIHKQDRALLVLLQQLQEAGQRLGEVAHGDACQEAQDVLLGMVSSAYDGMKQALDNGGLRAPDQQAGGWQVGIFVSVDAAGAATKHGRLTKKIHLSSSAFAAWSPSTEMREVVCSFAAASHLLGQLGQLAEASAIQWASGLQNLSAAVVKEVLGVVLPISLATAMMRGQLDGFGSLLARGLTVEVLELLVRASCGRDDMVIRAMEHAVCRLVKLEGVAGYGAVEKLVDSICDAKAQDRTRLLAAKSSLSLLKHGDGREVVREVLSNLAAAQRQSVVAFMTRHGKALHSYMAGEDLQALLK